MHRGPYHRPPARNGRQRLILLAPIQPAATGNGLAMRCEWFRRAAAQHFDVRTIVVPVAGRLPGAAPVSPGAVVLAPERLRVRAGAGTLVSDPLWRERLTRAGALPRLARAASPALRDAVADALDGDDFSALHVMRSYLAPLGVAVAERLRVRSLTLDLDEDDAAFARAAGDAAGAQAYQRLLDVFGGLFHALSAASASEAQAIGARYQLDVEHIPNAVECPPLLRPPRPPNRTPAASILFVGNLTYRPNVEAARVLVQEILPRVRRRLARPVQVRLVGPHGGHLELLSSLGVEVTGFVADLRPVYAAADVAVVPLSTGGGTRIKLLEAFAQGVPVVASDTAAQGLAVSDGRHLLLADDAETAAAAVARILTDSPLTARLVDEAHRLVQDRYCPAVVMPAIGEFLTGPAHIGRGEGQPCASP